MQVDVELNLSSRSAVRASDVVFSLNPGLTIDELKVNGEDTSFVHENGLLSLKTPDTLATDREIVVSVNATGVPDPEFAYLDSAIDPKREVVVVECSISTGHTRLPIHRSLHRIAAGRFLAAAARSQLRLRRPPHPFPGLLHSGLRRGSSRYLDRRCSW